MSSNVIELRAPTYHISLSGSPGAQHNEYSIDVRAEDAPSNPRPSIIDLLRSRSSRESYYRRLWGTETEIDIGLRAIAGAKERGDRIPGRHEAEVMGSLGRHAQFAVDLYVKVTNANLPADFYVRVDKRVVGERADAVMYVRDGEEFMELARAEGKDMIEALRALREVWRRRR
ncbi:hypothetical protein P171DRAFT_491917 [Karstenula rhodostoma CBS 690.94]|uniref:Uncharacterized protein n=1 Tax=Karstenula rhodostoma CBS 690.94 TaxID=1392251 RepID=A0A9P4P3D3_9PLEO|nr:hypothetical protein P171DRAFT_491917 [Karstenula rhodostoma CBS 690.94]